MNHLYRPGYLIMTYILLTAFIFAGCAEDMRNDLESAKILITDLEQQLKDIQMELIIVKLTTNMGKTAYLTPGATGYSIIGFDLGILTVSMENVESYANGSKVTFQFGNTLSATLNGLNVKIDYGSVDEKGLPLYDASKSKDVTFSESLKSGAWTKVSVILEGIPSSELGFVKMREITHQGISLSTR